MREEFLHYVWKHQYYQALALTTTEGASISIIHPGYHNLNSGPDFSMGKILLDGIEWHGHIEIHYLASDWKRHGHRADAAYDNVILHVVWKNDVPLRDLHQRAVPTLELKDKINPKLIANYDSLLKARNKIPCEASFPAVDSLTKRAMLDRVMAQRLEIKSTEVQQLLTENGHDWEETTYQLLMKNFGFKVNAEAMLTLGKKLPLKVLMKHTSNRTQLEALLLGQAGLLLNYATDPYPLELKKEYDYLAKKYSLHEHKMTGSEWKFSKMRPPNFPTIRLAEVATIVSHHQQLFSKLLEAETFEKISALFRITLSEYWETHYVFDKPSPIRIKTMGKSSIENIVLNTVIPLLVCYAKEKDKDMLLERAEQWLEEINGEHNNITNYWQSLGQPVKSAFDSQSLIGLYNYYCLPKACLNCSIGAALLSRT